MSYKFWFRFRCKLFANLLRTSPGEKKEKELEIEILVCCSRVANGWLYDNFALKYIYISEMAHLGSFGQKEGSWLNKRHSIRRQPGGN